MTARIGFATGDDPALSVRAFAEAVREIDRRGWEIAFFSETIGHRHPAPQRALAHT